MNFSITVNGVIDNWQTRLYIISIFMSVPAIDIHILSHTEHDAGHHDIW